MTNIPIIIVDDDDMDRYIMSRRIRESNIDCTIHEFNAGDEFLEVFSDSTRYTELVGKNSAIASVLLDINMPRMNGFEVLEKISDLKKQGQSLPQCFFLLMVTSSNRDSDRELAAQYSFVNEYMVKPLDVERFKQIINEYYP